jgi:hypothetical protein
LALTTPVTTFTDGRWVATIRWTLAARAFCANRLMTASISFAALTTVLHEVGQLVNDDDDGWQVKIRRLANPALLICW